MLEPLSISLLFFPFYWIPFSISMYIMCVCLFSALNRRVGALQISIIIIIKCIPMCACLVGSAGSWWRLSSWSFNIWLASHRSLHLLSEQEFAIHTKTIWIIAKRTTRHTTLEIKTDWLVDPWHNYKTQLPKANVMWLRKTILWNLFNVISVAPSLENNQSNTIIIWNQ